MRTVASVARCLTLFAFSVNADVYCAVSLGLSTADPATCDIRVSQVVPVARREVEIRIRVHNHGDERSPASEVSLRVLRDTGDVSLVKTVALPGIDGGKSAVLAARWTPARNGMYRVIAVVDPKRHLEESDKKRLHNLAAIDTPVVEKPLHFLSRHRRNCPRVRSLNTLCFSEREQERRHWEGRGMLLARHLSRRPPRERVPKATPENIASYWAAPQVRGYSAMVIDELGTDYGVDFTFRLLDFSRYATVQLWLLPVAGGRLPARAVVSQLRRRLPRPVRGAAVRLASLVRLPLYPRLGGVALHRHAGAA